MNIKPRHSGFILFIGGVAPYWTVSASVSMEDHRFSAFSRETLKKQHPQLMMEGFVSFAFPLPFAFTHKIEKSGVVELVGYAPLLDLF